MTNALTRSIKRGAADIAGKVPVTAILATRDRYSDPVNWAAFMLIGLAD